MPEHTHQLADDKERLETLLSQVSAYIEQYHGGWVKLVDYDGQKLTVKLGGACEGCALTQTTLHGWVAGTVRQFFPEITEVVGV